MIGPPFVIVIIILLDYPVTAAAPFRFYLLNKRTNIELDKLGPEIQKSADHTTQVRKMGNVPACLAKGHEKRHHADNQDKILYLNGKKQPEIYGLIRIIQRKRQQNAVNCPRSANSGNRHARRQAKGEQPGADAGDKEVLQKKLRAPATFHFTAEHIQGQHVPQYVAETAV